MIDVRPGARYKKRSVGFLQKQWCNQYYNQLVLNRWRRMLATYSCSDVGNFDIIGKSHWWLVRLNPWRSDLHDAVVRSLRSFSFALIPISAIQNGSLIVKAKKPYCASVGVTDQFTCSTLRTNKGDTLLWFRGANGSNESPCSAGKLVSSFVLFGLCWITYIWCLA